MADLSAFPVTRTWKPTRPDVIQLYSFPTPNGQKASIMLEETGLDYEPHKVRVADEDVKSDAFLSLNPNGKIPAILDPNGPDGAPLPLWESGAILIYLAEKSGQFLGTGAQRLRTIQWLMFQMGGVGPMFGQMGHFVKLGGTKVEDPYPRERYVGEARRLLQVIEETLADRDWLAGDYSIADIATAPWINALDFYEAWEMVGWSDFPRTDAYLARFNDRPAVQRGRKIPATD